VVVAFVICWVPFHVQRLQCIYCLDDSAICNCKVLKAILFYSSGILYYVNSVINPVLYNIMSVRFRMAFKTTLCCGCCGECCCREAVESQVLQATGGRRRPPPRRLMAPRVNVNCDGDVEMLRMNRNDRVHRRRTPGRRYASPASAPAKFSDGAVNIGHARSSADRLVGHGPAANTTTHGDKVVRRGGQPSADACPRYLYRVDWRSWPLAVGRPVIASRSTDRPTRVDNAY